MVPNALINQEEELLKLTNSAEIFNMLSDIPRQVTDVDKLIKVCMNIEYLELVYVSTIIECQVIIIFIFL